MIRLQVKAQPTELEGIITIVAIKTQVVISARNIGPRLCQLEINDFLYPGATEEKARELLLTLLPSEGFEIVREGESS